jgi:hypothetical protein
MRAVDPAAEMETKPPGRSLPWNIQTWSVRMKLSSASVEQTRNQITAQPIPANHPVVPQLTNLFGEHTFFLDEEGLLIVEPADPTQGGPSAGRLVKLASWNDANRKTLAPHEAEATDVLVELAPDGSEH